MTFQNKLKSGCIAGSIMLGLIASPGFARENFATHTLGSSENVYRIEIRNLDSFLVMKTGDDLKAGELHSVQVELKAQDQRHGFKDVSWELINNAGVKGGDGYLQINPNDRVRLSGGPEDQNLWIHTSSKSLEFQPTFTFNISTRELDCYRQRVCQRGDIGRYSLTFEIPKFTSPPPQTCGENNTFPITRINGRSSVTGLNTWEKTWTGPYGGTESIVAKGKNPGAILHPLNAEICIASTKLPATASLPERPATPTYEDRHYLRGVRSQRCLTLPRAPYNETGPLSAHTHINSCNFNRHGAQQWFLRQVGTDKWSVRSSLIDYCLNLRKSTEDHEGGNVTLTQCSNHQDQQWRKVPNGPGSFQLINVSTGKCLNIHGGRENRDWGKVSVYSCASSDDQRWTSVDESAARILYSAERSDP